MEAKLEAGDARACSEVAVGVVNGLALHFRNDRALARLGKGEPKLNAWRNNQPISNDPQLFYPPLPKH